MYDKWLIKKKFEKNVNILVVCIVYKMVFIKINFVDRYIIMEML